ncbi:MAG TPA: DNA-binding transcriptional regulator [Allosphingosinicella sp.]|nr:DNA-binding transcriptional regulator [Allosphingosinicella sp.]
MSKKRYRSDAFEAIHGSARALHRVGAIGKATMRSFDEACLAPLPAFAPRDIQRLREANNVSQPVFARYLNTSESTVEKWETGAKRPSGMALKLLAIVEKHGLQMLA